MPVRPFLTPSRVKPSSSLLPFPQKRTKKPRSRGTSNSPIHHRGILQKRPSFHPSPMAVWGGLRSDLVHRILARLTCVAHRAAFSAVCFNWRAVAAQPPPQLPWLLLPSTAAEAPVFFCLLCGHTHLAFLPDDVRAARCCGSYPRGWLVLELQQQGDRYALHNLRDGERLPVPGFLITADRIGEIGMIVSRAPRSPTRRPWTTAPALPSSSPSARPPSRSGARGWRICPRRRQRSRTSAPLGARCWRTA
jgi:hypothetical protein